MLLRIKDKDRIREFDDILPVDIESYVDKEIQKIDKKYETTISSEIPINDITQLTASEVVEKVVVKLVECNINIDTARKAAIKALKGKKKLPDLPVIINEALRQVFIGGNVKIIKPVKSIKELRNTVKK